MNKDEILKRAQNEKIDELEIHVQNKSMLWSYIAMAFAATIFSFIRSNEGLPMMDLAATVCFSAFVNQLYRFIKTKQKQYLLVMLIMLFTTIMTTIRFIMGY